MREGKFKIVLDCPLCKEHELQVQDTGEDNTIKQYLEEISRKNFLALQGIVLRLNHYRSKFLIYQ